MCGTVQRRVVKSISCLVLCVVLVTYCKRAMPKNKKAEAKARPSKARPFAKTIMLKLDDPLFGDKECEFRLKMDETLSDLADGVRQGDDLFDIKWLSWGPLAEMWFTTVEGTLIPMNVAVAKLIQDGLISDGAKLLISDEAMVAPPEVEGKGKDKAARIRYLNGI